MQFISNLEALLAFLELSAEIMVLGVKNPATNSMRWLMTFLKEEYKNIRRELLQVTPSNEVSPWRDGPDEYRKENHTRVVMSDMLLAWTRSSRRVYHIDKEMQKDLLENHLPIHMSPKNLPMPFQSFVVTVETPFRAKGQEYSTFIYGVIKGRDGEITPQLLLISDNVRDVSVPYYKKVIPELRVYSRRGNDKKVRQLYERLKKETESDSILGHIDTTKVLTMDHPEKSIVDHIMVISDPLSSEVMELIFCLVNMLNGLPKPPKSARTEKTERLKNEASDTSSLITDESELFLITRKSVLETYRTTMSNESEEEMGDTNNHGTHASPTPHGRSGHWRHYASGKVGWVRHTFVNAKDLDPGQLPGGLHKTLKVNGD